MFVSRGQVLGSAKEPSSSANWSSPNENLSESRPASRRRIPVNSPSVHQSGMRSRYGVRGSLAGLGAGSRLGAVDRRAVALGWATGFREGERTETGTQLPETGRR